MEVGGKRRGSAGGEEERRCGGMGARGGGEPPLSPSALYIPPTVALIPCGSPPPLPSCSPPTSPLLCSPSVCGDTVGVRVGRRDAAIYLSLLVDVLIPFPLSLSAYDVDSSSIHRQDPPRFEDIQCIEEKVVGCGNPRIFSYSKLYVGTNGFGDLEVFSSGSFDRIYCAVLPSDDTVMAVHCVVDRGIISRRRLPS